MASGGGFQRVTNPFDLPTYQKRIRHLRSVAVRNLVCNTYRGIEVMKMQTFFTLHRDTTSSAFYTSEKAVGSVNPTWKSFDISRYEKDVNLKSKSVVVRVWVCQDDRFTLLIDLTIHLAGLAFFAEKLQHSGVKYNPNTVIFGMFDKYFVSADESKASPELQRQMSEIQTNLPNPEGPSFVFKVDQTMIRGAYTSNSVSRIQTILRATQQTQATVNRIHSSIEDRLLSSQETGQKLSRREELLVKVSQLRSELTWQMNQLQLEKDKYDRQRGESTLREHAFHDQESNLEKSKTHHEEKKKAYVQTRETLVKENAQLLIRRKQLVGEMATYIYPIAENKKKHICICGVWLPNAEDYQGQDETMVAVGLGYTSHLTMMVSQFLDLPLRYMMVHRGSRSQIKDHIHTKLSDKDRDFPLYSKGKEKFQFNYGVFLLNKNISQIRFCCGLGTTDLRLTLPNFRTLLELRLGVKLDGPSTRSLTPTSGTGNSITSSTARDSTRSIAGSSSASSLARKEEVISAQQYDSSNNDTTNTSDLEDKENRDNNDTINNPDLEDRVNKVRKQEFDETDTLFEANDDDFFKISQSAPSGGNINVNSSVEDFDKAVIDLQGSDALIDQDDKLNDMEALKATLHIHFDNSDSTSSPSVSYDEGDISSGEERLQHRKHGDQVPADQMEPVGSGCDRQFTENSDTTHTDLTPVSTFKTGAFRTLVGIERESSPDTNLTEDYLNTAKVVS
ncbi:UV radiation resistance-associated protein-like isoform X2 [Haliotis rufescens]|uniref:UV radiation resistance-associated protein-like isoform X2 n=1 Tax=Haliotis rufescens TaxID=6454 RepID=UPI00201F78A3|nr:UV radiation resistance-associated protein-like isoform X2 [Haliotis rufescens]